MNEVHELLDQLADELQELDGLSATFRLRRGDRVVVIDVDVYEEEESEEEPT